MWIAGATLTGAWAEVWLEGAAVKWSAVAGGSSRRLTDKTSVRFAPGA